jgi:hypothetical protein
VEQEASEQSSSQREGLVIERVQTGARMQKQLLKVLKALAEYLDISLGDLLEGIVLHAFDGKAPFSPEMLERIAQLKSIYGLELDHTVSHHFVEPDELDPSSERRGGPANRQKGGSV